MNIRKGHEELLGMCTEKTGPRKRMTGKITGEKAKQKTVNHFFAKL